MILVTQLGDTMHNQAAAFYLRKTNTGILIGQCFFILSAFAKIAEQRGT
jgi:hypothetical protein